VPYAKNLQYVKQKDKKTLTGLREGGKKGGKEPPEDTCFGKRYTLSHKNKKKVE